jgi:murein DD-endopeptidase MepM/ murein hydrolase activator NlpD
VDLSSRHRYRDRRRSITARRRRIALVGCGAALLFVLGWFALQRGARPAAAPSAAQPATAVAPALRATAVGSRGPATPRPAALLPSAQPAPSPIEALPASAAYFDDRRFTYEPGFYAPQIQAFLDSQPSPLKRLSFQVGDRQHTFAEVLVGQTSYYSINPKVILALLELQSHTLTTASPSADQIGWAMGYHGENGLRRGLAAQVRWAVRQIVHGKSDYQQYAPLTYADNSSAPPPADMSMPEYTIARALAPTTTPDRLPGLLQGFQETYTQLFGDPRAPPADWPALSAPFLTRPTERTVQVTSFFDHNAPFLSRNGSIVTYWGRAETDIAFAYDGHDGWDYAAMAPDLALAAADGDVVFAGNADDNCATRAVILDHGNGYRSLYWHLSRVDAAIGQHIGRGQPVGVIGASGCAIGPHLHFGVQFLGRNTDPYGWCSSAPDPWQQNPSGTVSRWLWADRPSPCAPPPPDSILVDTDSPGFARQGDGWQAVESGYGGSALFVSSTVGASGLQPWDLRPLIAPAVAIWQPALPAAGRYRVLAYVPYALSGLEDATDVRYHIHYSGGEAEIEVDDQVYANDWADLGTYQFAPGDKPTVSVSSLVGAEQHSVWADALLWVPAGP